MVALTLKIYGFLDYKEIVKSIGISDIASLTVRTADGAYILPFGADGEYNAYIVTSNIKNMLYLSKGF